MFDKKAYQREYMARRRAVKAGSEVATLVVNPQSDPTLPVPVLADVNSDLAPKEQPQLAEARESTKRTDDGSVGAVGIDEPERCSPGNSRGGQNPSSTDQKFEEDRPGWYIFGKVEKEKNCWKCGKKYSTRLEMGRFCSPTCKTAYLDSASHLREIK